MNPLRAVAVLAVSIVLACPAARAQAVGASQFFSDPGAGAPERLAETGLYAPGSTTRLADGVLSFTPQYTLWSDGATKRRWILLPPGAQIDASDADRWQFPPGTRLWKEFSHDGHPVETRLIELREDGQWRFAAYVWNAQGTEATLAPRRGVRLEQVAGAPGGRYVVPARGDCIACHGSAVAPVLGFSALQLSPRRDPLAPGPRPASPPELDLRALVQRGVLRGLPASLLEQPPVIAADTAIERAVLGYLHANCGHCHNTSAQRVPLPLTFAQRAADPQGSRAEVLRAMLGASSRWQPRESDPVQIVHAGDPQHSAVYLRMRTRDARVQMPPLGTQMADADALALVLDWINNNSNNTIPNPKEQSR